MDMYGIQYVTTVLYTPTPRIPRAARLFSDRRLTSVADDVGIRRDDHNRQVDSEHGILRRGRTHIDCIVQAHSYSLITTNTTTLPIMLIYNVHTLQKTFALTYIGQYSVAGISRRS